MSIDILKKKKKNYESKREGKILIEVIKPPFKPYGKRKRKKLYIAGFFFFNENDVYIIGKAYRPNQGNKNLIFLQEQSWVREYGIVPERL